MVMRVVDDLIDFFNLPHSSLKKAAVIKIMRHDCRTESSIMRANKKNSGIPAIPRPRCNTVHLYPLYKNIDLLILMHRLFLETWDFTQ